MSGPVVYEKLKSDNHSIQRFYWDHAISLIEAMNLQKDEIVMDYGCGAGLFTERLFKPEPDGLANIFGVDINEDMIKFAKENSTHPTLNYSIGNIMDKNNWDFKEQSVDKVFTMIVLPYIDDYKTFLKKIYNLLTPGGLFGTMFPFGRPYGVGVQLGNTEKWGNYNRKDAPGMAEWFCKDVTNIPPINEELEACGFNLIEYHIHTTNLKFGSIHEFCEFLIAVNPSLGNIPQEFHGELIRDLSALAPDYLTGNFANFNEPFVHQWNSIRFVAQKQ